MAIHHTQMKQAEKIGVVLSEIADSDNVQAFLPQHALMIEAKSAGECVRQMQAVRAVVTSGSYRMVTSVEEPTKVHVFKTEDGTALVGGPYEPVEAYEIIRGKKDEWEQPQAEQITEEESDRLNQLITEIKPDDTPELVARSDKGVPLNGGIAHAEKFTAADCPYTSETEDEEEYANFERWNEEFDTHADEAEEEKIGGSVVKEEYRARYAEMGHPTHCGDDLAVVLNNLCQTTKDGTDLARLETICEANGVNLGKYNRTTNGWQGRLRMTGRNLLARKVFEAGGVLLTPVEGAEPQYQMSGEWLATRKFKKKTA